MLSALFDRPPLAWIRSTHPVVSVLRLGGVIGAPVRFRGGLSLAALAAPIERAFSLPRVQAVALAINSPGGSAVQSSLIYRRIRALAEEKNLPVYTFCEDVAGSGGYWLACAGDEIYADENSIIGSIGVIYSGFGFVELLGKFGIERRLHTAGDKKSLLDPFGPEKPADIARLKALQKDIHTSFKDAVKLRRAGKLKGGGRQLFSGEFWTGNRALELGLIDGIGDLRSVMRERFGEDVRLRLVGARRPLWQRLRFGVPALERPEGVAGAWAQSLIAALEERAFWERYGL